MKARVKARITEVLIIIMLFVFLLTICGCISHTVRGFGSFVEGIGTDIVQATDGYEKEKK